MGRFQLTSAAPISALAILSASALVPVSVHSQASDARAEWHFYGGDAASTKYSPLDQINRDNVRDLKIAWRWKAENFGPRPEYNFQATPLMVNGILYTTAGSSRDVVAIDAATGETLWMYRLDEGARGRAAPRLNHRGVAYWNDGNGDARIVFITAGYHLVALDATTGRPIETFGRKGIVDLYHDLDQAEPEDGQIGSSSPPIIVGDIVIVGAALQAVAAAKENVAAHVRGYNVRTGERVWTFHTIPQHGEFGNPTWERDSWRYSGNAGVWAPMSADLQLGYVYLPVETATNDFYGGDRPGHNLFADSLVCLDAKTGARVWHFQLVHHGLWDYDTVTAPVLLDITVDGKKIRAVAQISKQAFLYVFDRVSGKPVWPIVERRVARSNVPGEKASPTQPFPTKPAPFDLQNLTTDALIDYTPALRAEALTIVKDYELGGVFTPPMLPTDASKGVLKVPSPGGGANWQGGAADPETGIIYISSATRAEVTYPKIFGRVDQAPTDPAPAPAISPFAPPGPQGLPLVKPPYGRITAIDLNSGEHLWMIPNGDTPDWIKNHPALKGLSLPRTGTYERVGILVTKTLLFAGEGGGLYTGPTESGGNKLRAYDKRTGALIAEFELPANQTGIPMTYMARRKQFIVVAVGGVGKPAELVALTAVDPATRASSEPTESSVKNGVYSTAQAERGETINAEECSRCHSASLLGGESGAPSLVGDAFRGKWHGLTLADLYERIRATMPADSPGRLRKADYVDVLALILAANGYPPGEKDLQADIATLRAIKIER
jgi:quinoprotein glucose dehydrogenase